MSLNIYVNTNAFHFVINRLSSIDTKYHIWKLGVVLTDNVSLSPHKIYHQCDVQKEPHKKIFTFSSSSLSCISFGTPPCLFLDTSTTSSLLLICWTSPWDSRPFAPSCHLLLTMASRQVVLPAEGARVQGKATIAQYKRSTRLNSNNERNDSWCIFWLIFKKFQNCIKCICFSKQSLSESMIHNGDQTGMKELASWLILNINIIRSWK